MNHTFGVAGREPLLRRAVRLEVLTVGWNVVEGIVAVAAALAAGSVALLGFGVDSFVECASGLVLLWRLRAERRGMDAEAVERIDQRAHRLVGASLFLLASYVAVDASLALVRGERPDSSPVGIALTAVSIVAMLWLARAKRRTAAALGSRAPTPSRRRPASGSRSSRSADSGSTRRCAGGGQTRSRRSA